MWCDLGVFLGQLRLSPTNCDSMTCQTGKWETPFDPDLTKEDFFTVDDNTKV